MSRLLLITCLALLCVSLGQGHRKESWDLQIDVKGIKDALEFLSQPHDSEPQTDEWEVLPKLISALSCMERELKGVLEALLYAQQPYKATAEALEKVVASQPGYAGNYETGPWAILLRVRRVVDRLHYSLDGYRRAVYKIKYSLYQTMNALTEFQFARRLFSGDQSPDVSGLRDVISAFQLEFRAFMEGHCNLGQSFDEAEEQFQQMTLVMIFLPDVVQVSFREALFTTRDTCGQMQKGLERLRQVHRAFWERLPHVQDALEKFGGTVLKMTGYKPQLKYNPIVTYLLGLGTSSANNPQNDEEARRQMEKNAVGKDWGEFVKKFEALVQTDGGQTQNNQGGASGHLKLKTG